MLSKLRAAAGVTALAAAVVVQAVPAQADSLRNDQWYLKTLKITQAHAITKGSGVIVGLVDSGTYPHSDLKRNLLSGIDEIDGHGNGQKDQDGHGTQMASIIAAHGRSGNSGVLGIAPAAKILPVRTPEGIGGDIIEPTIRGVQWAVKNGATVINASFNNSRNPAFEDSVTSIIKNDDVVFVAGVGNIDKGFNIGDPAIIPGVLAVGAVDQKNRIAPFSVHDPKVEICAPGVDIAAAAPDNKYVYGSGTSQATAVVSGAAALVRSKFPRLSAQEVIHRLTATADDVGPPGRDDECGYGVLNIIKALTADVPPLGAAKPSASTASDTTTIGSTLAPTVSPTIHASKAEAGGSTGGTTILLAGGAVGAGLIGGGIIVFLTRRRRRSA